MRRVGDEGGRAYGVRPTGWGVPSSPQACRVVEQGATVQSVSNKGRREKRKEREEKKKGKGKKRKEKKRGEREGKRRMGKLGKFWEKL